MNSSYEENIHIFAFSRARVRSKSSSAELGHALVNVFHGDCGVFEFGKWLPYS
jgi:hypothetical protein